MKLLSYFSKDTCIDLQKFLICIISFRSNVKMFIFNVALQTSITYWGNTMIRTCMEKRLKLPTPNAVC